MTKELEEIRELVKKISLKYQDSNSGDETEVDLLVVVFAYYALLDLVDTQAKEKATLEKVRDLALSEQVRLLKDAIEKAKQIAEGREIVYELLNLARVEIMDTTMPQRWLRG